MAFQQEQTQMELISSVKKNRRKGNDTNRLDDKRSRNEELNQLATIFEQIDIEVIALIYSEHDFNYEKTVSALIEMADSDNDACDFDVGSENEKIVVITNEIANEAFNSNPVSLAGSSEEISHPMIFLESMFPDLETSLIEEILCQHDYDVKQTLEALLPLSVLNITTLGEWKEQQNKEQQTLKKITKQAPVQTQTNSLSTKTTKGTFGSQWKGTVSPYVYKSTKLATSEDPPLPSVSVPSETSYMSALKREGPFTITEDLFEKKVNKINEMFPDVSYHIIALRLEENQENEEQTIENLIKSPPPPVPNTSTRRISLNNKWTDSNMASRLKFDSIKDKYKEVEDSILESIYYFHDCNLDKTVETIKQLYPLYGTTFQSISKRTTKQEENCKETEDSLPNNTASNEEEKRMKRVAMEEKRRKQQDKFQVVQKKKNKIKSKIEEEIIDMSEKAAMTARVRDTYFRQATLAYLSGDTTRANELSRMGRQYHSQVKEFQNKMKEELLERTVQREEKATTLDLHGLFVKEALETLMDLINNLKKKKGNGSQLLEVITGAGKHSSGGRARIKPAVLSFLRDNGFSYKEVNTGVVLVLVNNNL